MVTREEAQAASERWRTKCHPDNPRFRRQLEAFNEARKTHPPDVLAWFGPSDLLLDFLNGETVTSEQAAHDESEWTCIGMTPAVIARLQGMLARPPDTTDTATP